MNSWELAILRAVQRLRGEADLPRLYAELPTLVTLTPEHLRETIWGGRPAYQHQVRSHISNLCEAGDLRRVGRGRYRITERGLKRIEKR